MPTRNRYKKEKYIDQRYSDKTGKWSFRVNVRKANVCKTFNETTYNDSKTAYEYAVAYRDKVCYQFSQGEVLQKTTFTTKDVFEESFELFIVREETRRKLRIYFNKYIYNNEPIKQLNKATIIASMNDMVNTCTDDTIQRVFSIWKRIVKTAVYKDYLSKDITFGIVAPKSHKLYSPKRNESTDKETLDNVINIMNNRLTTPYERDSYRLFLQTLYYTGLRPAELFALHKSDIHKDFISINKEIGSSIDDYHVVRPCKTEQSIRDIPICDELKPILNEAINLSKCDILFPTIDNDYYDSSVVSCKLRTILKPLGIDFHLYQLRHLFSTDLIRNGVDIRTIQELMGHASGSMTLEYARSDSKSKLNALNNR